MKASAIKKNLPEIPFLGRETAAQIIVYGIMAIPATILDFAVYTTLIYVLAVHYLVSLTIAFLVASSLNYVLQKRFTFEEKGSFDTFQFNRFLVVGVMSLMINNVVAAVAVQFLMLGYLLARAVALLCAYLVSYTGNRILTFQVTGDNDA